MNLQLLSENHNGKVPNFNHINKLQTYKQKWEIHDIEFKFHFSFTIIKNDMSDLLCVNESFQNVSVDLGFLRHH